MVMTKQRVVREWTTEAGLHAVVLMVRDSHNNGYVCVPPRHPFYGLDYSDYDKLPDIEVHGGLTYAGGDPVQRKAGDVLIEGHWFGYDCAHIGDRTLGKYGDSTGVFRGPAYCYHQCESLAAQLQQNKALLTRYNIMDTLMEGHDEVG